MKISQELIFIKGDFNSTFSFSALKSKCTHTIKTNTCCKNLFKRIATKILSNSIPKTYNYLKISVNDLNDKEVKV